MARDLAEAARQKLVMLDAAERLDDVRLPPRNLWEALNGDRFGWHSIRTWGSGAWSLTSCDGGPYEAEIVDDH